MLGLPLDSWLLIAASVGLGLLLEVLFLRARRTDRRRGSGDSGNSRTGGEGAAR